MSLVFAFNFVPIEGDEANQLIYLFIVCDSRANAIWLEMSFDLFLDALYTLDPRHTN